MRLSDYLETKDTTQSAFATNLTAISEAVLGKTRKIPQQTISNFVMGRIPKPRDMALIYVATAGAVQPNDFYDLPDLRELKP